MSHFAKVKDGVVQAVIVAEQPFIDSLPTEDGVTWVQTSYNTHGGVHYKDQTRVAEFENEIQLIDNTGASIIPTGLDLHLNDVLTFTSQDNVLDPVIIKGLLVVPIPCLICNIDPV